MLPSLTADCKSPGCKAQSLERLKMCILRRKERVKVEGGCLDSQGQDGFQGAPVCLHPLLHPGHTHTQTSLGETLCILPGDTKPDNRTHSGPGRRYVRWYLEGNQRHMTCQLWGGCQLCHCSRPYLVLSSGFAEGREPAAGIPPFSWDSGICYPGQRAHLAPLRADPGRCRVEMQPS